MAELRGSGPLDVAALALALGGFEARDEDVRLEPAPAIGRPDGRPRVAHLAGVDGEGRAVLVGAAEPEEAVLLAIDALAWCDACGDLLARRLGADERFAPTFVLILAREDERALAGLAALREDLLRVFVPRMVHSARGVSRELREVVRTPAGSGTSDAFDALDDVARGFGDRLADGLLRIDPDLAPSFGPRAILWRRGDAVLASLRPRGGRLEADVHGDRVALCSEADVERVLESALRDYLGSATSGRESAAEPAPRADLLPSGPLLSEDELSALRGEG